MRRKNIINQSTLVLLPTSRLMMKIWTKSLGSIVIAKVDHFFTTFDSKMVLLTRYVLYNVSYVYTNAIDAFFCKSFRLMQLKRLIAILLTYTVCGPHKYDAFLTQADTDLM